MRFEIVETTGIESEIRREIELKIRNFVKQTPPGTKHTLVASVAGAAFLDHLLDPIRAMVVNPSAVTLGEHDEEVKSTDFLKFRFGTIDIRIEYASTLGEREFILEQDIPITVETSDASES